MSIPKIIWQTHNYYYEKLPDHIKKTAQSWKNLNPGWEYRYMNHIERLEVVKEYPSIFKDYHHLDPISQADIWRYIVTYKYGGVYADMDSVCIQPLDYMLSKIDAELIVVATSSNAGHTNNANYAIRQNSPIMKNIIDLIEPYVFTERAEDYRSPWDCFIDVVEKSNDVSYDFSAAWHVIELKTKFVDDFIVDYYGTQIPYIDFIKKNNLNII